MKNTFDWYKLVVEQGRFEAEYGWQRMETTIKFHLTAAAGLVALGAFALYKQGFIDLKVVLLALLIAGCGAYSAVMLWLALRSSANWEAEFFKAAVRIEETSAFEECVGLDLKVWAQDHVKELMEP